MTQAVPSCQTSCPVRRLAAAVLLASVVAGSTAVDAQGQIFSDVAKQVGLDFVHFNGMSGELYYAEHMVGGAAFIDYDRDGDLDVYLVQGHILGKDKTLEDMVFPPQGRAPFTDRLYRNDLAIGSDGKPALRFVDVTDASGIRAEGYGVGVVSGDIDNDGWPDLYVNNLGANQMLRNRGDGTFEDVTARSATGDVRFSAAASFLDYDLDGWLDLYVGNYVDWSLVTHRPCVSASGGRDYCSPLAYEVWPDRLYRNRGDGTFEDATTKSGIGAVSGAALGVVSTDFNADGWPDVYVANDQMPNQLWLNQGDGTFVDEALIGGAAVNAIGQPEASMGVVVGDIDGNATEDLFIAHLTRETNTLYLNDGHAMFRDATKGSGLGMASFPYTGFGTALLDYDSDGWLDLFIANGTVTRIESQAREGEAFPLRQRNQLFRNLGGGSFEEITDERQLFLTRSEVSRGVATGDIDNDGDPDLLVFNNAGPARLLINNTAGSTRWQAFDLRDTWNGRAAIGARAGMSVASEAGPKTTAWRRVRTDGSYASSHDPRVLIAPPPAVEIDSVRIEWPDGGKVEWQDPPLGRYLVGALRVGALRAGPSAAGAS